MMRSTECLDDGSSIQEKIEVARQWYAVWGNALRQDTQIRDLLAELERNLKAGMNAMLDLGIVAACKRCDEEEGGSCCGRGLENKFDVFLLLINLLLGATLPDSRSRGDSCYFLTERGCLLMLRLVLCVDYLCPKIRSGLPRDQLIKLQTISGDELVTGFILYDAVKRFIRQVEATG
jgi:hypothetical protein